jgi:hypothetical protein
MNIKTITYQRVINLGNYESKRLEMTADISEGEDSEYEASVLMEMVERKVREEAQKFVEAEITALKKELRELKQQVSAAKSPEPENNDIPDDF